MGYAEQLNDVGIQGQMDVGPTASGRKSKVAEELSEWWLAMAQSEVDRTVDKAVEYGQTSLESVGRALITLLPDHLRSEHLALEMACAFYAQGKLARIFSSYERGEKPDADNWHDLKVYCTMAQRIQQTGAWIA